MRQRGGVALDVRGGILRGRAALAVGATRWSEYVVGTHGSYVRVCHAG